MSEFFRFVSLGALFLAVCAWAAGPRPRLRGFGGKAPRFTFFWGLLFFGFALLSGAVDVRNKIASLPLLIGGVASLFLGTFLVIHALITPPRVRTTARQRDAQRFASNRGGGR